MGGVNVVDGGSDPICISPHSLHLLRGGVNAVDGRVTHFEFCIFYPLVGKGLAPTYASTGGGRWHPQGDGGSVLILHSKKVFR